MDDLITERSITDSRFVPHLRNKDLIVRAGKGQFNLRFDTNTMQKTTFKEQFNLVFNFDAAKSGPNWLWFTLRRQALVEEAEFVLRSDYNPIQSLISAERTGRELFNLYLDLVRREIVTGELITLEVFGENNSWVMGGDMYRLCMQNRAPTYPGHQIATEAECEPAMMPQVTNMTAKRMLTNTLAQAEQALVASLQDARIGDEYRELIMRYYRAHIAETFKKPQPS